MPALNVIELLNERHGLAMPAEETALHKEAIYEEVIPQVTAIEPVMDFVRRVAEGYPLAVGSGGLRHIVLATLEGAGAAAIFSGGGRLGGCGPRQARAGHVSGVPRAGWAWNRGVAWFSRTPSWASTSATAAGMQSVLVASGPVLPRVAA